MNNRHFISASTGIKSRILPVFIFFCFSASAFGQRPAHSTGIGFQAGNPTGLTIQFYRDHGVSTDFLFAYNYNNFFFMDVHGLWNAHLDPGGHLHFFYGPGGFLGIQRYRNEQPSDFVAGFSGALGLNLVVSRLEFFGQVTPRLEVTPATNLFWGGGVGIRFYF